MAAHATPGQKKGASVAGERFGSAGYRRVGMSPLRDLRASRLLPAWSLDYPRASLGADVLAAVTMIGLLVPQAMAYADMAGAVAGAGLTAAVAGLCVYSLVGRCPQLIVAPVSSAALMTAAAVGPLSAGQPVRAAGLITVLVVIVALVLVTAGLLRLGFLASLLSLPVMTGFVLGLAVTIVARQIPVLLGVSSGGGSVPGLDDLAAGLVHAQPITAVIGVAALAVMMVGGRVDRRLPAGLVVLLASSAAVAAFSLADRGVSTVGSVVLESVWGDVHAVGAGDITALVPAGIGIAIMVYAESLAAARSVARSRAGQSAANRELTGLGIANLLSALAGGVIVGGGLSVSAANKQAGAATQLAGALAAVGVLVVALALGPMLAYLPRTALAAVIIYAVVGRVGLGGLRRLGGVRSPEFYLALGTFVSVLALGILKGVALAVALSLAVHFSNVHRPRHAVLGRVPGTLTFGDVARHPENEVLPGLVVYRFDAQLFFANVSLAVARVLHLVRSEGDSPVRMVLWDLESTSHLDTTSAHLIGELAERLRASGVRLAFARPSGRVRDVMRSTGLTGVVGEDLVFLTILHGVEWFLAHGDDPSSSSGAPQGPAAPIPPAPRTDATRVAHALHADRSHNAHAPPTSSLGQRRETFARRCRHARP